MVKKNNVNSDFSLINLNLKKNHKKLKHFRRQLYNTIKTSLPLVCGTNQKIQKNHTCMSFAKFATYTLGHFFKRDRSILKNQKFALQQTNLQKNALQLVIQ